MEKKVTVLMPNGRRNYVHVTPNTTLLQILEDVCLKHGFNSDEYVLRHHNKEVGLTQMFRFSGLPNNCMLEMWQTDKKRVETNNVDICVQLEDGSRQQAQFVPSDNLWHVVERLSGDAATLYKSPVAIYMRQEIFGRDNLTKTSLKSLGITTGRAMIRLLDKRPEDLKSQANVYIAPTIKETSGTTLAEASIKKTRSVGGGGFAVTKELVQSLKEPSASGAPEKDIVDLKMETNEMLVDSNESLKAKYDWGTGNGRRMQDADDIAAQQIAVDTIAEMEFEPEVHVIGERNAIIYSMDEIHKQIEELPDSFYDLTVSDLKLVLRDLKKIAAGNEDTPLLTEKLRELEENKTMLNKIAQYKNCVIRIKFPDRYVLQGIFKPIEKIANVMDFVRNFLEQPDLEFYLFTIPPKLVLSSDKTLLELDFVPTAVVYFGVTDKNEQQQQRKDSREATTDGSEKTYIKDEFLQKLTTADGAFYAASKMRISNRKHESLERDNEALNTSDTPAPSTGAIPKRPRNV